MNIAGHISIPLFFFPSQLKLYIDRLTTIIILNETLGIGIAIGIETD